jgi:hypothetical protein
MSGPIVVAVPEAVGSVRGMVCVWDGLKRQELGRNGGRYGCLLHNQRRTCPQWL